MNLNQNIFPNYGAVKLVSIPIRDLMNLNRQDHDLYTSSKKFQSLLGI